MSKQKENKSDRNKPRNLEMGAVSLDKQQNMDSSYYEDKYPDMKFMWIVDSGGEVDKYRRAGAVIQKDESREQFEGEDHGYKGKNRKGYVSIICGTDHGESVEQILLKMPKDEYQAKVIDPKHSRNRDIREAMGRSAKVGDANKKGADGSDVDSGDVGTYAPNLPTGGQGFEEIAGKTGFNKLTG